MLPGALLASVLVGVRDAGSQWSPQGWALTTAYQVPEVPLEVRAVSCLSAFRGLSPGVASA